MVCSSGLPSPLCRDSAEASRGGYLETVDLRPGLLDISAPRAPVVGYDVGMSNESSNTPLVSIVVRTKDRPALLREALESVVAQEWRPLEAVVVNDGGAPVDHVVSALDGRLPVRLVNHESSRGRAAAANSGVEASEGTWVGFLDDDDLYLPAHVGLVLEAARAESAEAAYAGCRILHPGTGAEGEVLAHPFDPEVLLLANYIPTCSVLIRREAIRSVGGFDESLSSLEDWDLWIRLSDRLHFAHTSEVTSVYRAGPASVGGDMAEERWATMEQLFQKHWHRIGPGAVVGRLEILERDIAGVRHELKRVVEQLADCEERLATAVHVRDERGARLKELEQQRDRLLEENRELSGVVRGALRLRLAGLLRRVGRIGAAGDGGEE